MSAPVRSAVFLDRDGVLNVYRPNDYVKNPDELTLLPGVGKAVRALNDAGLPVFLVSNQQGVAKGLMTMNDLFAVETAMRSRLSADRAYLTESYYCTHSADALCACRKPRPGQLIRAAHDHGIDLGTSFFIGDTDTDAAAARAAGIGTFILVLSGKFQNDPAYRVNSWDEGEREQSHRRADLPAAVEDVLARLGGA